MATKYSMEVFDQSDKWTPVALFSDYMDAAIFSDICRAVYEGMESIVDVMVIDIDTGEIVADKNPKEDDYEPADNCDDDCGFDPYMGCYTDDC